MNKKKKIKTLYKNQNYVRGKEAPLLKVLPEVFAVSIFFLVLTMVSIFFANFKYYQIKQISMQPLFNNYEDSSISDGVFIKTNSKFEVGDIIVLKDEESNLIKRVIATGGDKIAIVKKVFINRVEYLVQRIAKGTNVPYTLVEEYINDEDPEGMEKVYQYFKEFLKTADADAKITDDEGGSFVEYLVLAEDEIFYLGDNRGRSLDSARKGPAKVADVVGKVEIVIWKEQNFLYHIFAYFLGFKNI